MNIHPATRRYVLPFQSQRGGLFMALTSCSGRLPATYLRFPSVMGRKVRGRPRGRGRTTGPASHTGRMKATTRSPRQMLRYLHHPLPGSGFAGSLFLAWPGSVLLGPPWREAGVWGAHQTQVWPSGTRSRHPARVCVVSHAPRQRPPASGSWGHACRGRAVRPPPCPLRPSPHSGPGAVPGCPTSSLP